MNIPTAPIGCDSAARKMTIAAIVQNEIGARADGDHPWEIFLRTRPNRVMKYMVYSIIPNLFKKLVIKSLNLVSELSHL